MTIPQTIGFPRMMKEAGEKRVFLPEFVRFLSGLGATVFIEEGYGSRSGFSFEDYQRSNPSVRMCARREAFQQDVVMVLRSPRPDEFELLCPGACLISMLHFPTRPKRVQRLQALGVNAISLDSIANDNNRRLVEDMRAVAWNGLEAAFGVLEQRWPGLVRPDGQPIHVLILGAGMVGKHAVEAATKLGNVERNNQHMEDGGPGVVAMTIGRNVTGNAGLMGRLLREVDILVDASQRRDPSQPIILNDWIGRLPAHTVITDLAVDPYTLDAIPPVVRGIEGIPQGNLDKHVFAPDDEDWTNTVPEAIPARQRRTVVSCYSWPGVHPEASMRHYAQQLEPLMEVLFAKGYDGLSPDGGYFERALYRGTLHAWLKAGYYAPRPR
jgi:alanine dehydrogenase